MGEDAPSSFRLAQGKIPTNEARIRWGIGRPSRAVESYSTPSIDAEIAVLIKETGISEAPIRVYGKCNEAVRWDEKPWNPSEETLARLAIYSGNLDKMYSDIGPFSSIPFQYVATRNISNFPPKTANFEEPFYDFSNSTGGRLWQMSHDGFQKGTTDLCVFESQPDGQTGVYVSFKPNSRVAMDRGDLKLFFHIDLPNVAAQKLFEYTQAHPDAPFKLIQALFPTAFVAAVPKNVIFAAWRNKGIALLKREGTEYINYQTGFEISNKDEKISAEEAFTRLQKHEEMMLKNADDSIRMGRYAPQIDLALVDMRGASMYAYSTTRGADNTVGVATKILKVS